MTYDYLENMIEDIKYFIKIIEIRDCSDMDDVEQYLNDYFWDDDEVTGNGYNGYATHEEARGYLIGNEELLVEAIKEFGNEKEDYVRALTEPEFADTTIRCYLLGQAIHEALKDPAIRRYIQSEIDKSHRSNSPKAKKPTAKKSAPKKKAPAKKPTKSATKKGKK